MKIGGRGEVPMVLRYTKSISFEACLEHYRQATDKEGKLTGNLPSQCIQYKS